MSHPHASLYSILLACYLKSNTGAALRWHWFSVKNHRLSKEGILMRRFVRSLYKMRHISKGQVTFKMGSHSLCPLGSWSQLKVFLKLKLVLIHLAVSVVIFINRVLPCKTVSWCMSHRHRMEYKGRYNNTDTTEAILFSSAPSWVHYRAIQGIMLNGPFLFVFKSTLYAFCILASICFCTTLYQ